MRQFAKINLTKAMVVALPMILAFASPTIARAQSVDPCGGFKASWQSCNTDSDCAVGQNMCGFPTAYNHASIPAAEAYNKCMGPMISCAVPPQGSFNGTAQCKENKCVLVEN